MRPASAHLARVTSSSWPETGATCPELATIMKYGFRVFWPLRGGGGGHSRRFAGGRAAGDAPRPGPAGARDQPVEPRLAELERQGAQALSRAQPRRDESLGRAR